MWCYVSNHGQGSVPGGYERYVEQWRRHRDEHRHRPVGTVRTQRPSSVQTRQGLPPTQGHHRDARGRRGPRL